MKFRQSLGILAGCLALAGLSGCAKYKAKPLRRLSQQKSESKDSQYVSFAYRPFTKQDCKKYLDRNVIARGYRPIHLTISNNTNRYLDFSLDSLSLPSMDADHVASTVYTNTAGRAAGYGVAGVFIWPFLIPAFVDGFGSSKANEQLERDFYQKTLQDTVLSPYETINGLVFVPAEDYKEDFSLALLDKEKNQQIVLSSTNRLVEVDNRFLA